MQIIPGQQTTAELHQYLLGAVSPRPICFASTVDADGRPNLSPFSFFNVFGSNPTRLIFSPARRVRDNTLKHTLQNVLQTEQVVISVVNYAMVQQASLSSCEFPAGVDEFEKAGFTKKKALKVEPWLVAESPVNMECKVVQVIETGAEGGAGNLVICELLVMHLDDAILGLDGRIDPHKIDLVGRMGGDFYCRTSGAACFVVPKPNQQLGMGIDQLPPSIRNSRILTGNHLGMLANVSELPTVDIAFADEKVKRLVQYESANPEALERELHVYAASLLDQGQTDQAWQVLRYLV